MTRMSGEYVGELQVVMNHESSGVEIRTDAPKDNQGLGRNFSPTDLLASSLPSCMLTTVAIYAKQKDISIEGSTFSVEKIMTSSLPRMVQELKVELHFPTALSEQQREVVKRVAEKCPVHRSLSPAVTVTVEYYFDRE